MSIFNYFLKKEKKSSASLAKERLQIIVAHERSKRQQPDYLPLMQKEIMDIDRKSTRLNSSHR